MLFELIALAAIVSFIVSIKVPRFRVKGRILAGVLALIAVGLYIITSLTID